MTKAEFIFGMKELKKVVQLSESCIRQWQEKGIFPKSVALNGDLRAWDRKEIEGWKARIMPDIQAEMKKNHFGNSGRKWTKKYSLIYSKRDRRALEPQQGPFDEIEDVYAQMHSGKPHPLL